MEKLVQNEEDMWAVSVAVEDMSADFAVVQDSSVPSGNQVQVLE